MASRVPWSPVLAMALLWTALAGAAEVAVTAPVPEAAAEVAVAAEALTGSDTDTEKERAGGYREVVETPETFPEKGDLKATLRSVTLVPQRGYTPIQVTVHNSSGQPRPVRLSIHAEGRITERSLQLGPRERVVTYLMLPADLQSGQLRMDSPGMPTATEGFYLDSYQGARVMVLGDVKSFERATRLGRTGDGQEPLLATRFLDARVAPRELAAYVGYDAVLVTAPPEEVPDDVWAVLESFALSGGNLVLAHPPANPRRHFPLIQDFGAERSPYGFGQVRQFRDCHRFQTCGQKLVEDASTATSAVVPAGPPPRWDRSSLLRDGMLPLLASARAPVGRFMLLIFLFTLAVGPGGLMLARRKGPLAVLIAVPTLAAVTCLSLVAWSVLVDGFRVHSARYSFTLLDRERSRAVTVGLTAWYANLAEEGVTMPASSVLLATPEPEDPPRFLDWTQGMALRDSFLPSRTYREWGEVAVLPSRARLTVRKAQDGLVVQNALGADVESGLVRFQGRLWTVPAMADGGEASAVPLPDETKAPGFERERDDPWTLGHQPEQRFPLARGVFDDSLGDNTFLVRLGGRGFAPTAAVDVDLEAGVHLVRGGFEEVRP
ncbi:hypothetical protein G4177_21115 [Corallococcus sp. ZKHCc1 1396]|uniref:DUF4350 domain-containing protein n=1 Tax=Corallococcus soli TaxID=2710757 RepID=A0ABR9PS30_9BACT|nr:hypothetical protein [Corallococcus soli]MBE4750674.1 hypothetical protein [Corallococcus soli]